MRHNSDKNSCLLKSAKRCIRDSPYLGQGGGPWPWPPWPPWIRYWQVCLSGHRGGEWGTPVSGPRSLLGEEQSLIQGPFWGRGYPSLWSQVPSGEGYCILWSQVSSRGRAVSGPMSLLGEGYPSLWSQVPSGGGVPQFLVPGPFLGRGTQSLVPGPFWGGVLQSGPRSLLGEEQSLVQGPFRGRGTLACGPRSLLGEGVPQSLVPGPFLGRGTPVSGPRSLLGEEQSLVQGPFWGGVP